MTKPFVIAHRGASGYRPENTLEAFALGIDQGADGLEFDLVATKDRHLVIRHENALSDTTNVAELKQFESLKRKGVVDGDEVEDWFTEDFNLSQIKQLRARERLADLRPGSAKFDGQFGIPTFQEVLEASFITDKKLVVELKRGSHVSAISKSVGEIAAKNIFDSNVLERNVELIIESFDLDLVKSAKQAIESLGLKTKYFLALEKTKLKSIDLVELSKIVDGIAISMKMLFKNQKWVDSAHEAGLVIWAYTARVEKAETTIEAYYEKIIQTGVDGIFADQPDLLRRVLNDRGQ